MARGRLVVTALAIVLITLNLRIPVNSVAPLLPLIRDETNLSTSAVSLLTTIPLLSFLLGAPFVPRLLRLLGQTRLVTCSLIGITLGIMIRSVPGVVALYGGTLVLGVSIAVASVLAPSIVKAVPNQSGFLTGLYTMSLSIGPAAALGLTLPLVTVAGLSWNVALIAWSVVTFAAIVAWSLARRGLSNTRPSSSTVQHPRSSVYRERSAWAIALYLGLTSLTFYTTATWLPTVLRESGISGVVAAGMAAFVSLIAIPFALAAPLVVKRFSGNTGLLTSVSSALVVIAPLLLLPRQASLSFVAVLAFGVAQGACLGMAYALVVDRSRSVEHSAAVSAMSQTVGVSLAAVGPLAFGALFDVTQSWVSSLLLLAVLGCVQIASGLTLAVKK
ncbi:MFS transporter [Paramicrobacterium fandaimingii]|uniref:MFS transporter n=1 Tax=Paramicrobacterium fandaimingii TaxID=2708079 RepID=UPI0014219592|nr:MFS transporter [Microbacterium fandaimingii]